MKCLAVNTANMLLSLALTDGDRVLQSFESAETRDQGNLLLRHIQEALDKEKLKFEDLNLFAVVTGPGSFTGIRIGLATMRALSMAAKVPVIGISSFEMFASPKPGYINLISIESWREELYFQAVDEKGAEVIPPVNVSPEDFVKKLEGMKEPFVISGDAAEKLHTLMPKAALSDHHPAAAHVAHLAMASFKAAGHAERPLPFYLREADVTVAKSKTC
ncbi:MAG: tRNA (adenosine(37)-N6)-threonylcarbamoyltransferase complex dimerization subunit type 1 TsaB [Alphaproteobacteria bacterium]|nr:MAG: tRNA (adenosine(37)-N6)-threonylcarbamoyltransferase complex dimerization subunit type 1 TsaB [Alphaproteobacteria bacterium]